MQAYHDPRASVLTNDAATRRLYASMQQPFSAQTRMQRAFHGPISSHGPAPGPFYNPGQGEIDGLGNAFNTMNLQGMATGGLPALASPGSMQQNSIGQNAGMQQMLLYGGNGLYPVSLYSPQSSFGSHAGFESSGQQYNQYADQAFLYPNHPTLPITPQATGSGTFLDVINKDVPGLGDRKGSMSSTYEREQSSSPDTPQLVPAGMPEHQVTIAHADHSPRFVPIYGTPSPQESLQHYEQPLMLNPLGLYSPALEKMMALLPGPPIPPAVTALFNKLNPRKSLDECFSNPTGTTNVYIRGLRPETTDPMLLAYAQRFGRVMSSKSIIDSTNNMCKGYGFACYQTIGEAQNCIRGFYMLEYETGFAKESTNEQLKAKGDPSSTNLYVVNLPRSMTEAELSAVFMDYEVKSVRILRDEIGNSKGVGFARFETRVECDEVIQKFDGQLIGQERLKLQIRYSDTPEQKQHKKDIQARRKFRANQYNEAYFGTANMYQCQGANNLSLGQSNLMPQYKAPCNGSESAPAPQNPLKAVETGNGQNAATKISPTIIRPDAAEPVDTKGKAVAPEIVYGDGYSATTNSVSGVKI
ncbi:MAG: hypothetical protein M1817_005447 [Caeruleum heppii]|nr:MAG: hypothetical protein M1817_005447 [Caeruleum heppii]